MGTEPEYVYAWGAGPFGPNPVRAARKGQRCRVLIRSRRMRSVLLQFEDGDLLITSARAVRRVAAPEVDRVE